MIVFSITYIQFLYSADVQILKVNVFVSFLITDYFVLHVHYIFTLRLYAARGLVVPSTG